MIEEIRSGSAGRPPASAIRSSSAAASPSGIGPVAPPARSSCAEAGIAAAPTGIAAEPKTEPGSANAAAAAARAAGCSEGCSPEPRMKWNLRPAAGTRLAETVIGAPLVLAAAVISGRAPSASVTQQARSRGPASAPVEPGRPVAGAQRSWFQRELPPISSRLPPSPVKTASPPSAR